MARSATHRRTADPSCRRCERLKSGWVKATAALAGILVVAIVLRSVLLPVGLGKSRLEGEWQLSASRSVNIWTSDRVPEHLLTSHETTSDAARLHIASATTSAVYLVDGSSLVHEAGSGASPFPLLLDHANVSWQVRGQLWTPSNDVLQVIVPAEGARVSPPRASLVLVYQRARAQHDSP